MRGGGGCLEYFPITVTIFPHAENLELLFVLVKVAFVAKIIGENIISDLFYQFVVSMGKYLPQKRKVRENKGCRKALVIFADLSLLRQIFPPINLKHS